MASALGDTKKMSINKIRRQLNKMKMLSSAQAGFIQLMLQKIDRKSKPIKK